MKKAICHYSFHRRWAAEQWTPDRLAAEAAVLKVDGLDFHAGLLGTRESAITLIRKALAAHGRTLSSFSLSNNFNQDDADTLREQVQHILDWLPIASELRAPVVRVFGGMVMGPKTDAAITLCRRRALDGLTEVLPRAETYGLVLAVENHGGYPGTGEEHAELVRTFGSRSLRATVDVGNYLCRGQESHVGTALAAPVAAYVHLKDYRKTPSDVNAWGYDVKPCTVGKGDVDCLRCLQALEDAGYEGYVALEYEGSDEERVGVPESLRFMEQSFARVARKQPQS